ncbi:MAG TPA: hypothetical protein VMQ61_09125 [Thermoanaerobaculia bacterium]|nr:hypothetical protein [Thermoanaerobaculia bacterium]
MNNDRDPKDAARTPRICANEGCGRPAEDGLCENCALERSLFHREEREARRSAEVRTG